MIGSSKRSGSSTGTSRANLRRPVRRRASGHDRVGGPVTGKRQVWRPGCCLRAFFPHKTAPQHEAAEHVVLLQLGRRNAPPRWGHTAAVDTSEESPAVSTAASCAQLPRRPRADVLLECRVRESASCHVLPAPGVRTRAQARAQEPLGGVPADAFLVFVPVQVRCFPPGNHARNNSSKPKSWSGYKLQDRGQRDPIPNALIDPDIAAVAFGRNKELRSTGQNIEARGSRWLISVPLTKAGL
ncbi:hypothetical protein HPB50_012250 [Hyalomma asiaticum]|uniref:Uncharacterized protein n=1 Tax=Hyalomma asiaticum TaxID=266040 RepID=A0ACB7S5T0_HYAAI|nr:hypothetical protein HPB50_012250 [Hyalomma asiaticum]